MKIQHIIAITALAALAAQLIVGCPDVTAFAAPFNVLVGAVIVYVAAVQSIRAHKYHLANQMTSRPVVAFSFAAVIVASLVIGLVRQTTVEYASQLTGVAARLGLHTFARSWIFMWAVFWFMVSLASAVVDGLYRRPLNLRNAGFVCNHAGLWIAVAALFLGAADRKSGDMSVGRFRQSDTVYDTAGGIRRLPYRVELAEAVTEHYPSGEPKRFAATLVFDAVDTATVSVNHPVKYMGDHIYLASVDTDDACIVHVVRQPWRAVAYAGMIVMVLGAIAMFSLNKTKEEKS